MKNTRVALLSALGLGWLLMMLASCSEGRDAAEMAGTYVNQAKNEVSEVRDTLVISREQQDWFQLQRKTAYRLLEEGADAQWQYEQENWRAKFDDRQGLLLEQRKARRIYWQRDTLTVERRKYLRMR